MKKDLVAGVGLVVALMSVGDTVQAQAAPTDEQRSLAADVLARFEVVPLTEGVGLAPRAPRPDVRVIEWRDGAVAIDGTIVTGQELQDRLGADADLIVQLSYLGPMLRARLLGAASPGPAVAAPPLRRRITRGDIVRIGGSVRIPADERVEGDVVAIGGPLTLLGEATGDVVVIGGPAEFGPQSVVDGEVTVIGGPVDRAATATLRRGVNLVGFGDLDFTGFDVREWFRGASWSAPLGPRPLQGGWDLAGTVMRLVLMALLASLAVVLAGRSVEGVAAVSTSEPLKAGIVGLLAQLLLVPLFVVTVLLLVVSIVGIPLLLLLPFAVLAVVAVMIVGFAGAAQAVGRWVRARMGAGTHPAHVTVWAGVALLLVPTVLGEMFEIAGGPLRLFAVALVTVGVLAEYVAWTTGFGAIILNRFAAPASRPPIASPASSPDGGVSRA